MKKAINVRLPPDLLSRTDAHAESQGTTRTALIVDGLERVLGTTLSVKAVVADADKRAKEAIDRGPPSEVKAPVEHPVVNHTVPEMRNGDQALILERTRKHRAFMSERNARQKAIEELTTEGKL